MNKKYTKKQIQEAIRYWQQQLKLMNEDFDNHHLINEQDNSSSILKEWLKISKYIKLKMNFDHTIKIMVNDGVYTWTAIYITKSGDSFIVRGDHGNGYNMLWLIYNDEAYNIGSWGHMRMQFSDYVINNLNAKKYSIDINEPIIINMMKIIIEEWDFIKLAIQNNNVEDGRWNHI